MGLLDPLLRKVLHIAGVALPERGKWDIVSGATAVDNPTTKTTEITIASGGTEAEVDWTPPTATADESAISVNKYVTATNATPFAAHTFTHADETFASYTATVVARSDDGLHGEWDLRASYESTGGTFSVVRTPTSTDETDAGPPGGWAAVFDRSGSSVRVWLTLDTGVRANVITDAQIVSLVSTPAVFDISTLALSLWLEADFTASPWTSTASAGLSGARTATEATNPPAVGTLLGGKNAASFDGTNDVLTVNALIESDLFGVGGIGTVFGLIKVDNANLGAGSGSAYSDFVLLAGQGGYVAVACYTSAMSFLVYDSAARKVNVACTHNGTTWLPFAMRFDGTDMQVRVGSTGVFADNTIACTGMGDMTSAVKIGYSPSGSPFPGEIRELGTSKLAWSDADFDNVLSRWTSDYSL